MFGEDAGGKGTKFLAELYVLVDEIFHVGARGVGQDTASPQCTGSELHGALKPAHDIPLGKQLRRVAGNIIGFSVGRLGEREVVRDLFVGYGRPQIGVIHGVVARCAAELVVELEGGTDGNAVIPRGRLDPDVFEGTFLPKAAIHGTVERYTACETELIESCFFVEASGQIEDDVFKELLGGGGEIAVVIGQGFPFFSGWPEFFNKAFAEIATAGAGQILPRGIAVINLVPPVCLGLDHFLQGVIVDGIPIGGEAHDFVFVRRPQKAKVVGEGGVENAQGIGVVGLAKSLDVAARTDPGPRYGPLSDIVDGEERRLFEGATKEGAGGMGRVVFHVV